MTAPIRVLVIDDELPIRRVLRLTLAAHGFAVEGASTGQEGLYKAAALRPDVVVLDLGLPDIDGMTVLARIREWSTVPVIILSVRNEEKEKVAALDAGADDYVTKPFGVDELVARLRVALRHGGPPDGELQEFRNAHLQVDLVGRVVKKGGETVRLTATEYLILIEFVKNAGKVLTHNHLSKAVWGPHRSCDTQCLRVHMAQLRKKIEIDPSLPRLLVTEPGVGYRMPLIDEGGGREG